MRDENVAIVCDICKKSLPALKHSVCLKSFDNEYVVVDIWRTDTKFHLCDFCLLNGKQQIQEYNLEEDDEEDEEQYLSDEQ